MQPIQRGVELVLVDHAEAEHRAEAGGGARRTERTGGSELRGGIKDTADDQRKHEIAAAVAGRTKQVVEADPARTAEDGGDVAMRQRAFDADGFLRRRDDDAALEHGT